MQASWSPPDYKCVITPSPKQVIDVAKVGGLLCDPITVPVVLQGPDLTPEEFIALSMKLDQGTYEAATFLRARGYTLLQARDLLCVRGARVH